MHLLCAAAPHLPSASPYLRQRRRRRKRNEIISRNRPISPHCATRCITQLFLIATLFSLFRPVSSIERASLSGQLCKVSTCTKETRNLYTANHPPQKKKKNSYNALLRLCPHLSSALLLLHIKTDPQWGLCLRILLQHPWQIYKTFILLNTAF